MKVTEIQDLNMCYSMRAGNVTLKECKINHDFFLDLFAKNYQLSVLLLGQCSKYFGNLQGSQSFIIFSSHFHMNAAVCSHGESSADGLLRKGEIQVNGQTRITDSCRSTITM